MIPLRLLTATRVGQAAVDVAHVGNVGTGIGAAHRDYHVRPLGVVALEILRYGLGEVYAELASSRRRAGGRAPPRPSGPRAAPSAARSKSASDICDRPGFRRQTKSTRGWFLSLVDLTSLARVGSPRTS
jgi:hypothetical protein